MDFQGEHLAVIHATFVSFFCRNLIFFRKFFTILDIFVQNNKIQKIPSSLSVIIKEIYFKCEA